MKIRTRLAIAFLTITVVPISLILMAIMTLNNYQGKMFSETYGLDEQVDLTSGASIRVFSHMTEKIQLEIDRELLKDADQFLDDAFLTKLNDSLLKNHSFMILLKDLPNLDVIQDRCKLLVETLHSQLSQLMPNLPVSVSVGAAVAPRDGIGFQELYRHSDEALYTAKRRGKNQYKVYTSLDKYDSIADPASRSTDIDSDNPSTMDDDALMRFTFQTLYESRDVNATINELLAFIGMRFNVSRVYIFENNEENTHCSNTFEWCNQGISPEKDNLQNLSYETDIPNWQSVYDGNGMLYCTDTSQLEPAIREVVEPQGIRSMRHCAILEQGAYRGFVGFDECTANCFWTPGQVTALRFLAEILAVFLIKERTLTRLKQK